MDKFSVKRFGITLIAAVDTEDEAQRIADGHPHPCKVEKMRYKVGMRS